MPGNLIVYRVGTGESTLANTATAVFLDEYGIAGGLVQSISLPTTGSDSFTAVGSATSEGIISLSQDGASLIFTGYRKDVGGASPAGDSTTTTKRVIANVGLNGVVNTSIALADGPASTIRSATTVNGSSYYVSTSSGIRYIASPGAASTSVQIDSRNSRQVLLADNTLYASNGSNIAPKIQSYGTLPTAATTATPLINLPTTSAVNGMSLFDLSPAVPGVDTAYFMDPVVNQFYKYSFDGLTWNLQGSLLAGGAQNITGFLSGGTVNLFLTSPNSILPYVDTAGYNNFDSGIPLGAAIATAGTNTAFRGIAIAVPEPSTGLLCGLIGAMGLGLRRSRRQNAAA